MRTSVRLAVAAFVVGVATVPAAVANGVALSSHHVAKQPTVAHPVVTAGSWYQPDPLCSVSLLCGILKLPAISPYPKGTFHVATEVGRATATAYIAVHLNKVETNARGGTLTVPLDTSPTDGSLAPQTAKVKVCVIYQKLTSANGAYNETAPAANCLPSTQAKYVAKPAPHLVANLARFAGKLAAVKGFALLPSGLSTTTAWQVVFKVPTVKAQKSQLPTVSLLLGKVAHATKPTSTPKPTPHKSSGTGGGGGTPSDGGDGPVVGPAPTLPSTTSLGKAHNSKPVVAAPSTTPSAARFVTIGDQYPEVWLLPIIAALLVPFILRALTRDLTRRN